MVETNHPGLYFQEEALAAAVEGVSASVGAFAGQTKKGPWHKVRRITGWPSFVDLYGGYYFDVDNPHLPLAVKAFFDNGGSACWIARTVGENASQSFQNMADPTATSTFLARASNPGKWGDNIALRTAKVVVAAAAAQSISEVSTEVEVVSTRGFELGDVLVAWKGTNVLTGIIKEIDTVAQKLKFGQLFAAPGTTTPITSPFYVGTATSHRARTSLAQSITAGAAYTELDLSSTVGFRAGSVAVLVPGDLSKADVEVKITKIEGNTVFFASTTFPDTIDPSTDFHRFVSMEFNLEVFEEGVSRETHDYLSMEPENEVDYIQARMGWDMSYLPDIVPREDNQSRRLILQDLSSPGSVASPPIVYWNTTPGQTFDFGYLSLASFRIEKGTAPIPGAITDIDLVAGPALITSPSASATGAPVTANRTFTYTVNGVQHTLVVTLAGTPTNIGEWMSYMNTKLLPTGAAMTQDGAGTVSFFTLEKGNQVELQIDALDAEIAASLDLVVTAAPPVLGTGNVGHMNAVTLAEIQAEIAAQLPGPPVEVTLTDTASGIKATGDTVGSNEFLRFLVGVNGTQDALVAAELGLPNNGVNPDYEYGSTLWGQYWPTIPLPVLKSSLSGGDDGNEPGYGTGANSYIGEEGPRPSGIHLLDQTAEVSFAAIPNAVGASYTLPTVIQNFIDWAEDRGDLVSIISVPSQLVFPDDVANWRNNYLNRDSSYADLIYPDVQIVNPLNSAALYQTSAVGHRAGVYAYQAANRGPHIAPANVDLRGVEDLVFRASDADQDLLNPIGVNVIRFFSGQGFRPWGARTLWNQEDGLNLIPVRTMLNYIKRTAADKLPPMLFEPINEDLFFKIRTIMDHVLADLYALGAFPAQNKSGAYLVKCDAETTPPSEVAKNRVNVEITLVNPARFAEKIVLKLSVTSEGVGVSE